MAKPVVTCPYCGDKAELTNSKIVYGRDYGPIYLCKCVEGWAYVGVNKQNGKPLGRLADRELRELKKQAHKAFDPLWKPEGAEMTRTQAYAWLAKQMELGLDECHIGMFDIESCQRCIQICHEHRGGEDRRLVERDKMWCRAILMTLDTKEAEGVLRTFNELKSGETPEDQESE